MGGSPTDNGAVSYPAEIDIVRRACRACLTHDALAPLDVVDSHAIDWRTVATCIRANRLWWAMASIVTPGIAPDWLVRDALAARQKTMLINARALGTARRILPMLQREGLHPLVIKGPLQQRRLFATPFLRASTDLDILVPPAEISRAVRVLTTNGYRMPGECDSPWWRVFLGEQHLIPKDATLCEIDLHHRVQQPGTPGPRHMDAFVLHAESAAIGRVTVPTLSSTSAWLLSCLSLVKAIVHREPGGAYAMEVAAAAISADPEAIAAFETAATRQGLVRTALFSIGAVEILFGVDLDTFAGRPRDTMVPADRLWDIVFGREGGGTAVPRRIRMLWHLCDPGRLGRIETYAGEAAWWAGSEICRSVYHGRPQTPSPIPDRAPRVVSGERGITKDREATDPVA